jgi:hypothetical protein
VIYIFRPVNALQIYENVINQFIVLVSVLRDYTLGALQCLSE